MSDSVQPQRWQPTWLPHPWDPPGKNTGVGCLFLLQCMKVKTKREVAQSCLTLSNTIECSLPGSSVHGIFQARVLEWVAIAFSDHTCIQIFKWLFSITLGLHLEVELLSDMVIIHLIFWRTAKLFTVAVCEMNFEVKWVEVSSLQFWFSFPWWLMMLCFFSCVCLVSVYLFWRSVYSDLFLISYLGYLSFYYLVVRVLFCFVFFPAPWGCGALFPWPGIEPGPQQWKHLNIGPPGSSQEFFTYSG